MRSTTLVVVALLSMTLLALEIIWTRLFSAEFFYTFAFLILSLAIMGLGMGALALRLFPGLNREGSLGSISRSRAFSPSPARRSCFSSAWISPSFSAAG